MIRAGAAALTLAALVLATAGHGRADPVRATGTVRGDGGRLTLTWPAPVEFQARSVGDRHILSFARPAEGDFAAAAAPLQRFLGAPEVADAGRTLAFPLKPGIVALTFADRTRVVVDLFAGFPPPAATAGEPAPPPRAGSIGAPVPAPNRGTRRPAEAAASGNPATAMHPGGPSYSLRFDWSESVAAAAFRRHGALWLVFDRPSQQDVASLRKAGGGSLGAVEQRKHPRATVLRLETDGAAAFRRDGLAWILDLAPGSADPAVPIEPMLAQDGDGAALVLPVAEPGAPVAVRDPAVGDTLVVVPVVPLGHGLARERVFPDARLLASLQGVVVRPLVDDLQVRPRRESVEVARLGGLALTPLDTAAGARAAVRAAAAGESALGLETWARLPLDAHTPARQALEAALATANGGAEEERHWLRLAALDMAYGLAAESLGALERARSKRPELAGEAAFRLMRGAGLLLLGRLAEADAELGHESLAGSIEAAAWRTVLRVEQGRGSESDPQLAEQVAVVAGYPRVLRGALLPGLAEAAVDAREPALAAKLETLLAAEAEGPADQAEVAFLAGRRLAADGDVPGALAKWREVEAGLDPERRSQVRAEYASIDLALAEKRMEPAAAVDALEGLSFAWRGDRLELAILRRLGELQLGRNDLAGALRTFKRAAGSFPATMPADDIPAKMTDAFAALFVGENARGLSPLQAVALYDEFRELTPADAHGDRVIDAVVERMVDLDLLGRATALLESQVRFRLTGAVRAAAGARLASLYLLDDKPDQALKAVEATAEASLPSVLERDRQVIAARALARLGKGTDALSRLQAIETPDGWAARADVCWRLGRWTEAARALARLLAAERQEGESRDGGTPAKAEPDVRADRVLHLAVALALSADEAGLKRLQEQEGAAMERSRWKDVFPLIAANTLPPTDLQALAKDAGPIDRFRAYLASAKAAEPM